jgi:inositol phosphorylceramide mannosyltransferase catalytic subunit
MYQQKVMDFHPSWEYKLWTDQDNLQLVQQHYPHLLAIYTGLPRNIMRADMIRYLIMDHVGGLYLDLDYEMLKPFDLSSSGLVLPYNRQVRAGDTNDSFGNCIFASAAGHQFWKYVIKAVENITDYESYYRDLTKSGSITKYISLEEAITGPELLTRVFNTHKKSLQDYILPEREKFHPHYYKSKKAQLKIVSEKKSYGIHHCAGSWRDKSILKKGLVTIRSLRTW